MTARLSLFARLQRRNVHRAALFYGGTAWLLVQIATQVFPFFHIHESVVRWIVIAVIAGFPFAMLFSWFYEWTPQGIKRESEIDHSESITGESGKTLDKAIIAVLSLAVALLLLNQFVLHRFMPTSNADGEDKSIAVLPFEYLSNDSSDAYFASGIQDEILTRLAKIGALKVISRTSTRQYAAQPGNLPEIARQLGVANVLEGSVQKAGDTVHINVQLIRAASDEHLWADSYNRSLNDIFGVESEVAQTIAETLNAKLSGAEAQALTAKPTDNPAAYDAYARGRSLLTQFDNVSQQHALAAFQEAARLDPKFALAHAQIAIAGAYLYFNGIDTESVGPAVIKQAMDTATYLQPDLGEALLARGYYKYRVLRDFSGGLQDFEAAYRRLPNDSDVLSALVAVERRLGHWDAALEHARKAVAVDPRNENILLTSALYLYGPLRRFDEARRTLERAAELEPDNTSVISVRASIDLQDGRLEAARSYVARLPRQYAAIDDDILPPLTDFLAERQWDRAVEMAREALATENGPLPINDSLWVALFLGEAQLWSGRKSEAQETLMRIIKSIKPLAESPVRVDEGIAPGILAMAYALLGKKDEALTAAEYAVEVYRLDAIDGAYAEVTRAMVQTQVGEREAAISALPRLLKIPAGLTIGELKLDPVWDPLRGDPRFQKIIDDSGAAARL